MNPEKNINDHEEELLEWLEAEYEFLGKRLEEFKAWRAEKNRQYEKGEENDTDSATEFGMDCQKEMQNQ